MREHSSMVNSYFISVKRLLGEDVRFVVVDRYANLKRWHVEEINADVRGIASKEKGVWRIKKIEIRMNVLGSGVEDCFDEFQKYCAITESVKNGIPVELKLET